MNTPKLKTFFSFIVQKWWIVYGFSLVMFFLWLSVYVFGYPIPTPIDEIVFYPLISLQEKVENLNSIPLLILVLGTILFALKKKSFRAGLALIVVTLFSFAVVQWPVFPVGRIIDGSQPPTLTLVDSIKVGGHFYNLATYQTFHELLGQSYILYECDSLDFICHVIYRYKPKSFDAVYADFDSPPFLASGNTNITLHVAGEIVYVYSIFLDKP